MDSNKRNPNQPQRQVHFLQTLPPGQYQDQDLDQHQNLNEEAGSAGENQAENMDSDESFLSALDYNEPESPSSHNSSDGTITLSSGDSGISDDVQVIEEKLNPPLLAPAGEVVPDIATGLADVGENNYYIEKIVNYVVTIEGHFMKELFQAKWYNWPSTSNTWEPPQHVDHCRTLIEDFFKDNKRKYELYLKYGRIVENAHPRIFIKNTEPGFPAPELKPHTKARTKFMGNVEHIYDDKLDQYFPIGVQGELKDQEVICIQNHYNSKDLSAYLTRLNKGNAGHKLMWIKDTMDTTGLSDYIPALERYYNELRTKLQQQRR